MFPPFEPMAAARPFEPTLQRGQYARQRMMTLGDLHAAPVAAAGGDGAIGQGDRREGCFVVGWG